MDICYLKAMKTVSREIILILTLVLGISFFNICQFTGPLLRVPIPKNLTCSLQLCNMVALSLYLSTSKKKTVQF